MKSESTMVETLLNNKILTFLKNMGERKTGRDKKQLNIEKPTGEKRVLLRKWKFQGCEWSKVWRQIKNNVFQSTSTMVDASFNCFGHFVYHRSALKKIYQ